MPETPDTVAYLWLGLAVVFGSLGMFLGSLWLRLRNIRRSEQVIETLLEE